MTEKSILSFMGINCNVHIWDSRCRGSRKRDEEKGKGSGDGAGTNSRSISSNPCGGDDVNLFFHNQGVEAVEAEFHKSSMLHHNLAYEASNRTRILTKHIETTRDIDLKRDSTKYGCSKHKVADQVYKWILSISKGNSYAHTGSQATGIQKGS